jgi:hypothetical protein
MLPFSMERVLRKYGIPYEKFSWKSHRSREAKIARLKQKLKQWPLCLLIANAYGEGAKPRWFRLLYHWHYITLRGYDDQKQIVYIYDSNTKKRNFSHMPIGNTRMTYRELIHYRSIGASWMLRWYGISVQYS